MLTRGQIGRVLAAVAAMVLLITGCTREDVPAGQPAPEATSTSATPSPTPLRPFTVATTEAFTQTDPVAVTTGMGTALTLNVFQKLMTMPAGGAALELKPDAARDCMYASETMYVCDLQRDLYFHNGHRLTSSDVRFSIERARRIGKDGSSASLLSSLKRIETPDDYTIRFILSHPDTQFGLALASPAAAIVDEQVYKPDQIRGPGLGAVGSGPFLVGDVQGSVVRFDRFGGYKGPYGAALPELVVQRFADSGAVEDAMRTSTVDVVWRGLSGAALSRLDAQLQAHDNQRTDAGYQRLTLTGARVVRLGWQRSSQQRDNAELRSVVAGLLQQDRTLASIVPNGVEGSTPVFETGGTGGANITWKAPIRLMLGYDAGSPELADLALQIKSRLEASGGLTVEVSDHESNADLLLTDRPAWTWTAVSWLQPYLDHPAIGSSAHVQQVAQQFAETTNPEDALALLAQLQKQSAADLVLLPISQGDEQVYTGPGVTAVPDAFGPSWQLGLWGFNR